MEDTDLADEIIARLNKIIEDPDVRKDVAKLIDERVSCSKATLDHPTIQAAPFEPEKHTVKGIAPHGWVGVLGLLNGIVGVLPDGPKKGWGHITAVYEDTGTFRGFVRTQP